MLKLNQQQAIFQKLLHQQDICQINIIGIGNNAVDDINQVYDFA